MSTLTMHLGRDSYPITVESGALERVGELFSLRRRVLILTDSGVPAAYARTVAAACAEPHIVTLEPGERRSAPPAGFCLPRSPAARTWRRPMWRTF